jgi:hypothetical protein
MADKYIPPRTFGDVADRTHFHVGSQSCRFCKAHGVPVAAYGLRQNICKPCAEARRDQVLPKVLRWEKFQARMKAAGLKPVSTP